MVPVTTNQIIYSTSIPYNDGKSPFFMGKSPFLMGKSPFLMVSTSIEITYIWSCVRVTPEAVTVGLLEK